MTDRVSILLVDDQPARLLSYETILEPLHLNLVSARSGIEALELLMKREFAVVLLDVSMPGMDGFETAALIHDHPRFERTPIIFVTGVHISEFDRLKGYKLGAVDYVYIPVIPEVLRSKVAVLVELYTQRSELRQLNRSLEQANSNLQTEKNRELQAVNATLTRANAELAEANLALQREVAERTRAEEALKEADRHKDEFLAMLSHELRNPLAPIQHAVHLMSVTIPSEPQLSWLRDLIKRQVRHLTRLVDDLLDVSRITRGKIKLGREPVDCAEVVTNAIETIQPLLLERQHALQVQLPSEPLTLLGDATRLTQVLGNVLSNAAKYTPPGGQIELSARVDGAEVEICVRDNGIGIAQPALVSVFDLFTQAGRIEEHTQGGLGIGLALVKRLVELHNGTVVARSAGANQGSEFVIRLPRAEVHEAAPLAPPAECVTDTPVLPRRILIADDNLDALESLAVLLRLDGHEVHTAADGVQALEVAEQCHPEVALLDIGMPKRDGYEVARQLRSQEWSRGMALIALTGWGQERDRRRSDEAGFDEHWVKPLDPEQLTVYLGKLAPPAHVLAAAEPRGVLRSID